MSTATLILAGITVLIVVLAIVFIRRLRATLYPPIPPGKVCDTCGRAPAEHVVSPRLMECRACYTDNTAW